MGKQKGEGARSKNRPSSSSSAASLLPIASPGIGFGGYLRGSRIEPPSSSSEESTSFTEVDSELAQHLKRLSRKDPKTKVKASEGRRPTMPSTGIAAYAGDELIEAIEMEERPDAMEGSAVNKNVSAAILPLPPPPLKVAYKQVFSMLPGFSAELMPKGHEKESQAKIKKYMTMMDSMTNEELDSTNPKLMNESRMMRIARGSGRPLRDVMEMMEEYTRDLPRFGER